MCDIRLLNEDEIEVKVKQVTAKGAQALLYKTSRTDMAILDETFGKFNWTDDYRDIDGVLYCGIGIRETVNDPFVWKWSNGIESRKDEDGNEVKGEASDALKRAGFLVGIGRELYTAPFIWLKVETAQKPGGKGFDLVNKFQKFSVKEIGYDDKRRINRLVIVDQDGNVVYKHGTMSPEKIERRKRIQDIADEMSALSEPLPWEEPEKIDAQTVDSIWSSAQEAGISENVVFRLLSKYYRKNAPEELTADEGKDFLKRLGEYRRAAQ